MDNISSQPFLLFLILLPFFASVMIYVRKIYIGNTEIKKVEKAVKILAYFATISNFLISIFVLSLFDTSISGFQFVQVIPWLVPSVEFSLAVDGISMPLIVLTTFIFPLCVMLSNNVKENKCDYFAAFLMLESFIIGAFCANDLVLFYVFFEATLIPMFLIIGIWGSKGEREFAGITMPSRVYATIKFFLFTFFGSVFMLIAIAWLLANFGSTNIPFLKGQTIEFVHQYYLFLAFFIAFAVKIPMFPVHTWLPDAHVQAPTTGSVILAALLLKLGGYGFMRVSVPLLPNASEYFSETIIWLSVIAIIYTSLVALAQKDMKKLIAYTSIAHMGFVTMGIFTLTKQGMDAAIYQMISHGLISAALFICVGVLYDRKHTREIEAYGGLFKNMPIFAFLFLVFTMANIGLPGTSGFVGEFYAFLAIIQKSKLMTFLAATGVILSACYGLRLYKLVTLGKEHQGISALKDLTRNEAFVLAVLFICIIIFGFNTTLLSKYYTNSTDLIIYWLR